MIRLYIEEEILKGTTINLKPTQAHYLLNVMRQKNGAQILVFNESCGEWAAQIVQKASSKAAVLVLERIRCAPEVQINRSIAFACIKSHNLELIIEKATEIAIDRIFLLHTDRSIRKPINLERLKKIAIEASEQCRRISIPKIESPQDIAKFLQKTDIIPAVLSKSTEEIQQNTHNNINCIIVGPEGGFSEQEMELMSQIPKISLGENTLRAETAAIIGCYVLMREADSKHRH